MGHSGGGIFSPGSQSFVHTSGGRVGGWTEPSPLSSRMWSELRNAQQQNSPISARRSQRSYSPAANVRGPGLLLPSSTSRPGYTPRSSSLSLISNANSSSSSLPGQTQWTNGSALKREISPPEDVQDPLEVLERIIGAPPSTSQIPPEEDGPTGRPVELVEDIPFGASSLEAFLQEPSRSREAYRKQTRQWSEHSVEECEYVRLIRFRARAVLICSTQMRGRRISSKSFTAPSS
jgi:hypothetical protein